MRNSRLHRWCRSIVVLLLPCTVSVASAASPTNVIWLDKPAAKWDQAFPIGNGRLGAMVFGTAAKERIQFNESTLTSDGPNYRDLPLDVTKLFPVVTNLLAQRQYREADQLVSSNWLGRSWACYQPMGDVEIQLAHADTVSDYRRELDLEKAECRVMYSAGGVRYLREYFASNPDGVISARLSADRPGSITGKISLTSPHPFKVESKDGKLSLSGQAPGLVLRRTLQWVEQRGETWKYPELWDHQGKRLPQAKQVLYGAEIGGRGLHFNAQLIVRSAGGKIATHPDYLEVSGADSLEIILAADTAFKGYDQDPESTPGPSSKRNQATLTKAVRKTWEQLFQAHQKDYRSLFDRVALDLGPAPASPSSDRLKNPDPALAALYFQFGRYLMISGSRPGGQPLNLQGIWNAEVIPPWASGYTININTEMNYWPAEVANLPECAEPLHRMIRELSDNGRRVAREMYHRSGWVAHHNTTLWRDAQPVDNQARTSFWPMGSGWLSLHLYEHYLFTGDKAFLRKEGYPLMKGASEFYLDWLVKNGAGKLVTPVSTSPENGFAYTNSAGKRELATVSPGSTADLAIIHELFRNTIESSEVLGLDRDFRARLQKALADLSPLAVGARGQLMEWQEDFDEPEITHRHLSHLIALHPGRQITARGTPQLAQAARRTLELRTDAGTGWSKAWKVNFWARLEEGDRAEQLLSGLFKTSTLPNLLDVCPPFQIDGNFGGCAGIAEMLLQSHTGEIHLLPALPKAWPKGHVKGLRARGGFEVEMTWDQGQLVQAKLVNLLGDRAKVRYGTKVIEVSSPRGRTLDLKF